MPRRQPVIEEGASSFQNEELFLKSIDKDDDDSDNYPCILLKNAIVYSKNGKEMANLLHCATEGPFTIQGILSIPKRHKNIQLVTCNAEQIQINNCTSFSFDGDLKLWARGLAGWFELKPAPIYESVFTCMLQAIDLYNFLLDTHDTHEKPKNRYNKDLRVIFAKYSEYRTENEQLPDVVDEDQLAQFLLAHATFLISQMCRDQSFVDWPRTTIFDWLVKQCPDIYQSYLQEAASNRSEEKSKPPTMNTILSQSSIKAWSNRNTISDANNEGPFHQTDSTETSAEAKRVKMSMPDKGSATTVRPNRRPHLKEEDELERPHSSHAGKGAGKKALARTPAKRSHEETVEPSSAHLSTLRQGRYMASPLANQNFIETYDDDDENEEDDGEEDDEGEDNDNDTEDIAGFSYAQDDCLPLLSLHPESRSLPSIKPTGPNHSWICKHEDCGFEVPAAHRSKGREAVRSHIYDHASEEERKVMFIQDMGESRKLPIDNLIARVRQHAVEQQMQLINGRLAPMPIKRKLLR